MADTTKIEDKVERKKIKRAARKKAAPKAKRTTPRGSNKKKVKKLVRGVEAEPAAAALKRGAGLAFSEACPVRLPRLTLPLSLALIRSSARTQSARDSVPPGNPQPVHCGEGVLNRNPGEVLSRPRDRQDQENCAAQSTACPQVHR